MTVKHLFRLAFLICLYGCSGNSDNQVYILNRKEFRPDIENDPRQGFKYHYLQFGLYIENGPRRGMPYVDTTGAEYNYRTNTITIWNDSTVAIQLEIGFPEVGMNLKDSIRSKTFLLPRHLTPKEQRFDKGRRSKELTRFLDFEIDKPVHLSQVLRPREKCVLTFGVLTDTKYRDPTTPYGTELLTSQEGSSAISLKLKINDTLTVPCGQFWYMKQ
ncbi:MAG: hypothetical protein JWO09_3118 [Bacteroidetes bacterium]|nr:hypothetical protein [Bacteroidota bacterium]